MAWTGWAITAIRRRASQPGKLHAVDAMIDAIEANPGIVVVTLGPLTNLALAVTRKPALAAQVGRCVVMGGAPCCEGNVTPAAEYNIWVDPEAARIVMLSGLPVELVGWQTCRGDAVLNEADIATILGFNNPTRPLCHRVQQPGARSLQRTDGRRRHLAARSGGDERRARSRRSELSGASTTSRSRPKAS